MSSQSLRRQLENKRKQRMDAEKKLGEYRTKESKERSAAAKARAAAEKARSESTRRSKLREADRHDRNAAAASTEMTRWQTKVTTYSKAERDLASKVAKAEKSENDAAEQRRRREEQQAERQRAANEAALKDRVSRTEQDVDRVMRELRAPKPEKLRVLMLGSASAGDLRVSREQSRIRNAVESALHRDLVELDARPSATTRDLLDGITRFRPHVVHFSGHSSEDLIEFEDDLDQHHEGVVVTARAFASAVNATDTPPLLVLLNSCDSAHQAEKLVGEVVPFAIGMAEEIGDVDAINYAAQFYAAVANGQSIKSSHLSGQAALELAGLPGAELPLLFSESDVDPGVSILVEPLEE
ncbi:hypothetical protein ABZ617_13250 [Nocardiopsis alba]|uniref:hypothetical protein n=1 Tax=Nocardiopsis alba TaxID=53437 RepID=UPI0033D7936D